MSRPPSFPRGGRGDLLAEGIEELPDRPFEQLEGDVAGEAVGHDDIRGEAEQLARLGVAREVEPALAEQRVRLERELVALLGSSPIESSRTSGFARSRISSAKIEPMWRELHEVLGPRVGVRPRVDQDVAP